MSKIMVNSLDSWKKILRNSRRISNQRGLVSEALTYGALSDVADYKLKDGRSVTMAIHEMINECIRVHICEEDDNPQAWKKIVRGSLCADRGDDPLLSKALGERMLEWIWNESDLMGYFPFRILLACQGFPYLNLLLEKFEVPQDITECDGWVEIIYDTLQTEALKEENIMPMIILPIYMCFRHRLRSDYAMEQNDQECKHVARLGG